MVEFCCWQEFLVSWGDCDVRIDLWVGWIFDIEQSQLRSSISLSIGSAKAQNDVIDENIQEPWEPFQNQIAEDLDAVWVAHIDHIERVCPLESWDIQPIGSEPHCEYSFEVGKALAFIKFLQIVVEGVDIIGSKEDIGCCDSEDIAILIHGELVVHIPFNLGVSQRHYFGSLDKDFMDDCLFPEIHRIGNIDSLLRHVDDPWVLGHQRSHS